MNQYVRWFFVILGAVVAGGFILVLLDDWRNQRRLRASQGAELEKSPAGFKGPPYPGALGFCPG